MYDVGLLQLTFVTILRHPYNFEHFAENLLTAALMIIYTELEFPRCSPFFNCFRFKFIRSESSRAQVSLICP